MNSDAAAAERLKQLMQLPLRYQPCFSFVLLLISFVLAFAVLYLKHCYPNRAGMQSENKRVFTITKHKDGHFGIAILVIEHDFF
jgi:hypothetical protein